MKIFEASMSDERFPFPFPALVAIGVAVIGTATLFVEDHRAWGRSKDEPVAAASITANAVERRAGVTVTPSVARNRRRHDG
jgi:hypothetical protein